ncbi:hypothetical protein VTO58DRAFT_108446 [Aureobasidium pullulans]
MSSSSTKSKSSGSTVKPSSTSSTSSKVVALPSKLSSSISIATKPFSSSSKASRSSAQSASKSSSSKAVVSSSSKSSLSLPTITATSSKITSSSKASSSQQTSSSRATSSLQPSVTSSLPFCSVQASAFGGNIVRLAQASQYCSSLLRSTVSTVATSTKVVTITLPTVQGTATRYINSTVESTVVVAKVETENVIISVTAQSTATQTSDILDYVETTNIGATSVTTVTEVTTSTVTLDTDSSTPVAMVNRDVDVSGVLVPEVWSGLPSTQLRQACNCILDENSVDPTTVYSSKTTQTQTTTEMSSFEAETTATNLVTSLSTSTHTSTLRLNLTSTVSTRVSDYTLTSIRNATYTISSDSFATSTQHIIELTTYSPIRVPTPTASDIPAVALSQPTAIAGNVNGAPNYVDDQVFSLSLPVALTLYGQSSTNVMVSSNAVLGLGSIDASLGYEQMPITRWLGPTVLGLWEDLLIYAGTQQGIYYQVSGSAPSRQTTFEFYIGSFRSQTEYYHFLIKFAEDKPNIVTYQYLEVSDRGATAVVGVQDNDLNQYMKFSYQQPIICPGMQITFDTTPGQGSYRVDVPDDFNVRLDDLKLMLDASASMKRDLQAKRQLMIPAIPEGSAIPNIPAINSMPAVAMSQAAPVIAGGNALPTIAAANGIPTIAKSQAAPAISGGIPVIAASNAAPAVGKTHAAPVVPVGNAVPTIGAANAAPSMGKSTAAPNLDAANAAPTLPPNLEAPSFDYIPGGNLAGGTYTLGAAVPTATAVFIGENKYVFPAFEDIMKSATVGVAGAAPTGGSGEPFTGWTTLSNLDTRQASSLAAAEDGNFYMVGNTGGASPGTKFYSEDSVAFKDESERMFHYYPNTMSTYGVSRLRAAQVLDTPLGAQLVTLVPVSTPDGVTAYVAADTDGHNYLLAWCTAPRWQGSKVFLVSDYEKGLQTLLSGDVQWIVTGNNVTECDPLVLTSKAGGLTPT